MPLTKNKPRGTAKKKLRSLLPDSAATLTWEGKKFVAVPERDVDAWLEDLVDGIEATLALREDGKRLSQQDVKSRYGIE